MAGCLAPSDPETGSQGIKDPAEAMSQAEGMKVLESMGFSKDKIVAAESAFIVESDMVFTFEALARAARTPLSKTSQRMSTPISNPSPNLVKVAIHSSMSDWAAIIHQAINNWNSFNTRLHLELVAAGGNITIYSDASLSCPTAMRNLPIWEGARGYVAMGGSPGAAICVNRDARDVNDDPMRVSVLTHELGHTIGFHHTSELIDPLQGTQIPGTPLEDNKSIMGFQGSARISPEDIKALEIMYPSDIPLGGTDLDGDRKDDIVVWRPRDGMWYALRSNNNFASGYYWQWGQRGDMPMADMDMDGDGRDDKVVWRTGDGYWHAVLSSTGAVRSIQWGMTGDIPVSNHDMDGDGKDDLVVWRWTDGKFYVLTSRSNYTAGAWYGWGGIGDVPVGGIDMDRDGKDEWIIWRARESRFYVEFSASNFTTAAWYGSGRAGDIPVGSMDLDRDYKDDLVVWRPSDGSWIAITSGSNFASTQTQLWGGRGDVPVIGTDIDQDGRRDIVVWAPLLRTWYIKKSNSNFTTNTLFTWGE